MTEDYAVPAFNELSGIPFMVDVTSSPDAPTVQRVTVRSWTDFTGATCGEAVVHFDPQQLATERLDRGEFSFDVTLEAAGGTDSRPLVATDGDDTLHRLSEIDAEYNLRAESPVERWAKVTQARLVVSLE